MGGNSVSRILVRERAVPTSLFVALPHDPMSAGDEAHWWRVAGDTVQSGVGSEWLAMNAEERPRLIGLAPAALVRLAFSTPAEGVTSARQTATIARVGAIEQSLGDPQTLHTATAPLDGDPPSLVTAVAANSKMQEWIDWSDRLGIGLDHILPAAMVLPLAGEWTATTIGSERIIGRRGIVLPDEPALADALIEPGEPPIEMEQRDVELALARLAALPRPDLRTGRFVRRRRIVIDRGRLRELAILALSIIAVTTVIAIAQILKLDSSRAALDAETLEIARAAAGPGVTLESAEAALAARAGQVGGEMSPGVAALLARLQPEQNVTLSALDYSGGSLRFTVAAQGSDAINRVLLALQRDGYRVTAVPRIQSDGRTVADVTLGGGT